MDTVLGLHVVKGIVRDRSRGQRNCSRSITNYMDLLQLGVEFVFGASR